MDRKIQTVAPGKDADMGEARAVASSLGKRDLEPGSERPAEIKAGRFRHVCRELWDTGSLVAGASFLEAAVGWGWEPLRALWSAAVPTAPSSGCPARVPGAPRLDPLNFLAVAPW